MVLIWAAVLCKKRSPCMRPSSLPACRISLAGRFFRNNSVNRSSRALRASIPMNFYLGWTFSFRKCLYTIVVKLKKWCIFVPDEKQSNPYESSSQPSQTWPCFVMQKFFRKIQTGPANFCGPFLFQNQTNNMIQDTIHTLHHHHHHDSSLMMRKGCGMY